MTTVYLRSLLTVDNLDNGGRLLAERFDDNHLALAFVHPDGSRDHLATLAHADVVILAQGLMTLLGAPGPE